MNVASKPPVAAEHAIRRVVTGHDDNGKAIIEMDGLAPNVRVFAKARALSQHCSG